MRLEQQEKLVAKITPWFEKFEDQGLMVFNLVPRNMKDIYQIASRALEEILKIKRTGITPEELSRAKAQLRRRFIFENEDLNQQSNHLVKSEILGGMRWPEKYF